MADQLSLFPSEDLKEDKQPAMDRELSAVDEMFLACRHFRNSGRYFELLHFISRFPRYSALNGLLLYLQNPQAAYVATAGNWQRRFHRKPKYQARPLTILAPMSPVRFVYDIHDTEGEPFPEKKLKELSSGERFGKEINEKTIQNARLHGISVGYLPKSRIKSGSALSLTFENRNLFSDINPEPWTKYLISIDPQDAIEEKYASLARGLSHIFCGHLGIDDKAWWPDRRETEPARATIEAESSTCLVCLRKGLVKQAENMLTSYRRIDCEMPPFGLSSIFNAVHYIEEMGKDKWKSPKRKSRY